jgi:PAS domain S-box-containing protein
MSLPATRQISKKLFGLIVVSVFSVELVIMLVLKKFLDLTSFSAGLVDAILLTAAIFPILYYFIFKSLAHRNAYYQALAGDLEKFKLAVANASDHITITDADGTVLYVNKGAENITGFKAREIVGKKVGSKDLWGGGMDKAFYAKMWKRIKTDKKVFVGEVNNHRKNGEPYIARVSINPILNQAGAVVFFVAIERDITKEKMIDQAKSDFISLASHQLRTPLSAMKWTLEAFAGDQGLTAKHQERLRDLYVSNERLIALVNDLLNVSHITDKKIVAKKQTADLAKTIKNLLETIKVNADKKQQTLKMKISLKAAKVNMDIVLFGETFNNLVSNAINYAPAGARIDITLSVSGQNYLIAVHNDEPIIPVADQAKLFTKFYRSLNSQTVNTAGTGLGLFIAKAAAEANGGKIWFASKAGIGTTFYFTVPKK